ncbi:glutamate--cysteine ligase EgtA [Catellatospora sp. TT07R-123]|uniref:glutamate-cysteine ligase family protein n=1 Tax=Catellatospora sp. TT07R-123 TaxID=2733863 RepID=UPI001B01FE11|nr:glutamate-cysteine ligase family protein [Catellatospora sp. TT07R-123]GHJ44441.1 glutamate--cysteine ligase EgtA [Catellatospora sp. TT07R-123]
MSRALSEPYAEEWVFNNAFVTQRIGCVGVELEWLVVDPTAPLARPDHALVEAVVNPPGRRLPYGSAISFESGGQVELSTLPAANLTDCLTAAAEDMSVIRNEVRARGLRLIGAGLDSRPARRLVDNPRYVALEAAYDQYGPVGRQMMCNAASVQVNVDAGDDSAGWRGRQRRWWLLNTLGPALMAMFANSLGDGGRSTRQLLRFRTDPTRTDPVPAGECRAVWTAYALDAQVTGVRMPTGRPWLVPPVGFTMRHWLRGQGPRAANLADLRRHLKSVIPPVRARGHLEIRMIDAQRGDDWAVPATVVAALLDDPTGSDRAAAVAADLPEGADRAYWIDAAREGMARPDLAAAARSLMEIALDTLHRIRVPAWAAAATARFADRYTDRGRCPADDGRSA